MATTRATVSDPTTSTAITGTISTKANATPTAGTGEWDRYYRAHPHLHRHGHYYHDDAHLMFRYCDPDGGGCFFFSIGH